MSRRSLLLLGGGSGGIAVPQPSSFALTSGSNGGTNPWNIPGAIRVGSTTYVGYADSSGNVEAVTYTDGGSSGGPHTIHAAFEADAHTGPAFVRRSSDGRFVAIYAKHNATPINLRISTNPDDVSAWGSATDLDSQLGATRYTDIQLYELSDGTLFLFYRDEPSAGTDSRWCYSIGTWGGSSYSWAAQTVLFRIASTRSYVISWKAPGSDVIHFCATNGASTGYTKLGHFTMDGLTLARKKTDGTSIGASLPLTFTDITTAYSGTGGVQPTNLVLSGSEIAIGAEDTIAGALRHIYCRWNGAAWTSANVAAVGAGYEYSGTGTGFGSYGGAVDDGDINTLWLLRQNGSGSEWWRYRTGDGGTSWAAVQVTSSGTLKTSAICVRNPGTAIRAYCLDGPWSTYTSWGPAFLTAVRN